MLMSLIYKRLASYKFNFKFTLSILVSSLMKNDVVAGHFLVWIVIFTETALGLNMLTDSRNPPWSMKDDSSVCANDNY